MRVLIRTLRSKLYLLTTAWSIKCCWLPYFVAYWNNTLESELFKQSFLFTSLAFETHTATGGMVQISASPFSFQCLSVCVPISWTQQNPGRNTPSQFWYTLHIKTLASSLAETSSPSTERTLSPMPTDKWSWRPYSYICYTRPGLAAFCFLSSPS